MHASCTPFGLIQSRPYCHHPLHSRQQPSASLSCSGSKGLHHEEGCICHARVGLEEAQHDGMEEKDKHRGAWEAPCDETSHGHGAQVEAGLEAWKRPRKHLCAEIPPHADVGCEVLDLQCGNAGQLLVGLCLVQVYTQRQDRVPAALVLDAVLHQLARECAARCSSRVMGSDDGETAQGQRMRVVQRRHRLAAVLGDTSACNAHQL